jgi:hypothetical protein
MTGTPPGGDGNRGSLTPPPPVAVQQTTVIQVSSPKSVAGAVLLALFFGPLGMLYATVPGALIMFVISLMVALATLGLGLLITLPICAIWAGIAASNHNQRLHGTTAHQAAVTAHATASPAGWHDDPEGSGRLRYYDGTRWTAHFSGDPEPQEDATAVTASPAQLPEAVTEAAESTAVFCGSCGREVLATARFCPGCGEAQAVG